MSTAHVCPVCAQVPLLGKPLCPVHNLKAEQITRLLRSGAVLGRQQLPADFELEQAISGISEIELLVLSDPRVARTLYEQRQTVRMILDANLPVAVNAGVHTPGGTSEASEGQRVFPIQEKREKRRR